MFEFFQRLDEWIVLFFQDSIRLPFLDAIMIFMSYIGYGGIIWIVVSLSLMTHKRARRTAVVALVAMALCYAFNDLAMKHLVNRPRPFETIPGLTVLTFRPISYSFPSGHACSSFAAAFILSKGLGRKGAVAYILAALIAISRVYVGVHYASDVLVGAIIGTLGALAMWVLCRKNGIIRPHLNPAGD